MVTHTYKVAAWGREDDGVTPIRHDGVVVVEGEDDAEVEAKLALKLRVTFPGLRTKARLTRRLVHHPPRRETRKR